MSEFKALNSVPVVNVADFSTTLAFYTEKLGFTISFELGPYAGMQLGEAWLHLNGGDDEWSARPTSVRFNVEGIDDYYAGIDPSIVKDDEQLQDMPFGVRQFSVVDPSGNRVTFAQAIN